MNTIRLLAFGLLPLLASPVLAQDGLTRDLTVEQTQAFQAGGTQAGPLRLTLTADRADLTYASGEAVRLFIQSSEEAYVTVFDVAPSGQVIQLFPNPFQTDNHIAANRQVEIAGGATGASLKVTGTVGAEFIKVVASRKPVNVVPEAQLSGRGMFRSLDGGVGTLVRDLQIVADQPAPADDKPSFGNLTLRTIAARPAVVPQPAPQAIVVIPGQPQAVPAVAPAPVVTPAR